MRIRLGTILPALVALAEACGPSTTDTGSGSETAGAGSGTTSSATQGSNSGGTSGAGSQGNPGSAGTTSTNSGGSSGANSQGSSGSTSGSHSGASSSGSGSSSASTSGSSHGSTGGSSSSSSSAAGSGSSTSGASSSSGSSVSIDCTGTLPSGGTQTCTNTTGVAGSLDWQLWSNTTTACITTYGDNDAFSATWNESSSSADLLARAGLVWTQPAPYTTFGTITAQFAETKSGTGGGFSYIGIYGWSLPSSSADPQDCHEFYIVDDSFNKMPVNPGNTVMTGTATIDGGDYILYTRQTSGTGGSNCPGVSTWTQFYSVRETARTCGQISVTDHFNAWAAAGMTLGNLQEAQILVETGGGDGSAAFTTAVVTATQ